MPTIDNEVRPDKYALSPFETCLLSALKSYADPEQLGKESPLASPYFLSHALKDEFQQPTAYLLGETLRKQIRHAAADLWGGALPTTYEAMRQALIIERQDKGSRRYAYLVLELRYFRQFLRPRSLRDIYENPDYLLDSKAGDYRAHRMAIQQLGEMLLARLQPALRLEKPVAAQRLVGYEAQLARCLAAINRTAATTIAITGAGGTGKTSLATTVVATVVATLPSRPIFWYTIRPTLNDHLGSLLFALGYFLHSAGASNLWRLLLTIGGGMVEPEIALAMARQDFAEVQTDRPLLCIDEVDQLDGSDLDPAAEPHQQVLEFLQALRGTTTMLLIGQRIVTETDEHLLLTGLAAPQIQLLLAQHELPASEATVERLYRYTHGNPRLLHLCIALHKQGDAIDDILTGMPLTPGFLPLLKRLWLRLSSAEQQLLEQLAVFRAPVPDDSWPDAVATIQGLQQLRLIIHAGRGAFELVPALRTGIYHFLSQEQKEFLHFEAAGIRQQRAEYTAAAYHYWQANHPAQAIQLWFAHRAVELRRGQADAAYTIFHQLSPKGLSENEHQALILIRAELHRLLGSVAQGLVEVEQAPMKFTGEMALKLNELRGEFEAGLGYTEESLATYGEGRKTTLSLLQHLATLHLERGRLFLRQRELDAGWQEAEAVAGTLHTLQGRLYEEAGRYTDAQSAYQQALASAESGEDEDRIAFAHRNLANIFGRQQKHTEAITHAQRAMQCYEQLGDRWNVARVRADMAFICGQTKHFAEAIAHGLQAYHFFEAANISHHIAITAGNLADSYMELGDLDQAQFYAKKVLDQEDRLSQPYAHFNLGRIALARHAPERAAAYLMAAQEGSQQNQDTYLEAYIQRELGKVFQAQQRQDASINALERALELFQFLELTEEIAATTALLLPARAIGTGVSTGCHSSSGRQGDYPST